MLSEPFLLLLLPLLLSASTSADLPIEYIRLCESLVAIDTVAPGISVPTPGAVSPVANSGNFTLTYSDPNGANTLNVVNVLINSDLDGSNACSLAYVVPSETLVPDGGPTGCPLLTQVQQDSQLRSFAYDSLGNLVSADNPETGRISYRTDANGNVTYQGWDREAAQPVSITRSYDALNRLTSVSYTGAPTPPVTYCYDGNSTGACDGALTGSRRQGRLTSVINRIGRQDYGSWDALGRLQNSRHTILGGAYAFSYGYANWLGDRPKSQVYPSGKQIAYDFDTYARPLVTTGYATINTFSPAGQPTQTTLGNNVIETAQFNRRLQPTLLTAGPGMSLEYSYGTTTNNGNVQSQRIQRSAGWSAMQYYNYDSANRLALAAERPSADVAPTACPSPGLEWCHQYSYDFFGNRLISNRLNSVPGTTEKTSFNLANNRVANSGWDFTQDGLLKSTPSPATTFTYDAEGRQVTAGEESYGYDGTGARVWRRLLGGQTRTYVYDGFGRLATEVGSPGSAGRVYLSQDHLGSVRLVTNADGSVRSCRDFEPFGVRMDASGGNRRGTAPCYSASDFGTSLEYTGKERDAETGLDYFGARYMSAAQGRFTGPDIPLLDQHLGDPQSWNLYGYVRNNPLIFTDPSGNDCVYINSAGTGIDGINNQVTSNECGKTCGYWVDGTVTQARFSHGSLSLTGTTNGEDRTSASYGLGPDSGLLALQRGTQIAEPAVTLSGEGLMLFAAIAAPLPTALLECASEASGCSSGSLAMAMIPGGGGGKTGRKVGEKAYLAATESVDLLRRVLKRIRSTPNKTPATKEAERIVEGRLKDALERLRKSEPHGISGQGPGR